MPGLQVKHETEKGQPRKSGTYVDKSNTASHSPCKRQKRDWSKKGEFNFTEKK